MLKNFLHWGFRRKSARVMANGLLFDEQRNCEHHADSLRQNRRDGRARGVHVKARNQNEVARNVDKARHQHEKKRRAAVAKTSKDGREQVIRNDEENSAAADAHIARRETDGLLRRLHQNRDRPGKAHEQDKYPDG